MKLFEITVAYNKTLCPDLWDGKQLHEEVRETILLIADKFVDYLDVKFDPEDIVLTGSLANYNWSSKSDVDIHLLVNFEDYKKTCPDFTDDFFNNKKTIWNDHHEITIHGYPVEVYVQDSNEEHAATGVYSVLNDEWLIEPEYNPPEDLDKSEIEKQSKIFKDKIDALIGSPGNNEKADKLKDEIRAYRKKGLDKDSDEFCVPNLVFKDLRHSGYMEKLVNYIRDDRSEELSL